jgi:hypothetical protein
MTTAMLLTLSFSSLALSLSTYALVVARRTSAQSLSRRLSELSEQHSELVSTVESQSLAIRNLRSRANMAVAREKKANAATNSDLDTLATDAESVADRWTRETNLKIATGQIRTIGRR